MDKEKIARINELARLKKQRELTREELDEQSALRQQYLSEFKESFRAQLEQIYIKEPNGKIVPLNENKKPN